jgi:hypothetical protein
MACATAVRTSMKYRNGMALRDFRGPCVGLEHDEHRPAQPAKVGQPQRAGMVLDAGPGCDGDAPRLRSLTAGTGCRRDRRTVSCPHGGTHVFAPSMGGCEVERHSGTPATDDFALGALGQHVKVLDSLPKFSSREKQFPQRPHDRSDSWHAMTG